MSLDLSRFAGRRVLVTGHTGFKGAWLSRVLVKAGAEVTGFSLPVGEENALFTWLGLSAEMRSLHGDIRDAAAVNEAMRASGAEIVLHLAAQPLVLASYEDPTYTFGVNVMGTANLLDAVRHSGGVTSVVNVTTDKVYENQEWDWAYREVDRLGGHDPYSNSKACSELVTSSFAQSFLTAAGVAVSTARAGNVIGGGDVAENRIVPDCVRAASVGQEIGVRNPHSVRPYQHVLEPLGAYLGLALEQAENPGLAGSYNIGPADADNVSTGELVAIFCDAWADGARWNAGEWNGPHEAGLLRLDSSKIASRLGWRPRWGVREAITRVVEWEKARAQGEDLVAVTDRQIAEYFGEAAAG
ncbi:CDP-glucose 4,6-dehydratase [Nocardioides sp.]|uniref:CDP-glucose 4,6-dehydratase n=1 Tax=Nocardioides sp. TaxID=35761 RepID=UPI002612442F|nr:CDP-glucose 4,6-dehydratase [Nocardioides sp.]